MTARIKRSVLRLSIPLKEPFVTSTGVVSERELLLLRLEASDGTVGHGEAAPFEPYDGVPLEQAAAALTGGGGRRPPQARAAEEIARLDLHARQEDRPLAEPRMDALPVNMTLAAGPPEEVAERARAGLRDGYACFKLKVGLPDDPDRVAAVREAIGPWPALRVDANGAWTVDEAVHAIRGIEGHDLELVEQPCRTLEECVAVRRHTTLPMVLDEIILDVPSLLRAVSANALEAFNLKLSRVGGLTNARLMRDLAQELGLRVTLEDTWGGDVTSAAVAHLAASTRPEHLLTVSFMNDWTNEHIAGHQPRSQAGFGSAPTAPGLGIDVDVEALGAPLFVAA